MLNLIPAVQAGVLGRPASGGFRCRLRSAACTHAAFAKRFSQRFTSNKSAGPSFFRRSVDLRRNIRPIVLTNAERYSLRYEVCDGQVAEPGNGADDIDLRVERDRDTGRWADSEVKFTLDVPKDASTGDQDIIADCPGGNGAVPLHIVRTISFTAASNSGRPGSDPDLVGKRFDCDTKLDAFEGPHEITARCVRPAAGWSSASC